MVSIDTGHRSPERFGVPRAARGRSGPGGLLVIEDYDNALPVTAYPPHPDAERVVGAQRVTDAVLDLMSSMGHDGECGRKLPSELEALGLEDVRPRAACA